MKLSELNELDLQASGEWPWPVKAASLLVLMAVIIGTGFWAFSQSVITNTERQAQRELELRQTFESKQKLVANLAAYQSQMEQMQERFDLMLRQLPRSSEVAALLTDISRAGVTEGLEFELFRPEQERPMEFYVELPISMRVTGSYHQFANFVSRLAAMPRIVTLHDLQMGPPAGADGMMVMSITAKTYRYLDDAGS